MITQWIQHPNFQNDDLGTPDVDKAVDNFLAFQWEDELEQFDYLIDQENDCCPPGCGLNTSDGQRVLHIYSHEPNYFCIHFIMNNPNKLLGFIPLPHKTITHDAQSIEAAQLAIKFFYSDQYERILQPLQP